MSKLPTKSFRFGCLPPVFFNKICVCICVSGFLCDAHSQLDAYFIIRFSREKKRANHQKFTRYFMLTMSSLTMKMRMSIWSRSVLSLFRLRVVPFLSVYSTSVSDCEDVMTALWSLLPRSYVIMFVNATLPFVEVAFAFIAIFADNSSELLSRSRITYVRTHST